MSLSSEAHIKTLRRVLFSQLQGVQGQTLSEETVESLLLTCGDSMLLAALDLVDSADGENRQYQRAATTSLKQGLHGAC